RGRWGGGAGGGGGGQGGGGGGGDGGGHGPRHRGGGAGAGLREVPPGRTPADPAARRHGAGAVDRARTVAPAGRRGEPAEQPRPGQHIHRAPAGPSEPGAEGGGRSDSRPLGAVAGATDRTALGGDAAGAGSGGGAASKLLQIDAPELQPPAVVLQADVALRSQDAGVRLAELLLEVVEVDVHHLGVVDLDEEFAPLADDA